MENKVTECELCNINEAVTAAEYHGVIWECCNDCKGLIESGLRP